MNAFILIDKPKNISSFNAIKQLKKYLKIQKCGHGGTLDPMATGLLVVALGKATKILNLFLASNKTYTATVELGKSTSTDDAEGKILQNADISHITQENINKALKNFVGKQKQTPPLFSAVHVNGQRAYKLARNEQTFELKPKEIEIFSIKNFSYTPPLITFDVHCSAGTYIRSLARDLGNALNIPAHLHDLRRTQSGIFSIENAHTIDKIKNAPSPQNLILPLERVLEKYPQIQLTENEKIKLDHGQKINFSAYQPNNYTLVEQSSMKILALLQLSEDNYKIIKLYD